MPAEQLFNKFSDIAALEKEKGKIVKMFGEIKAGIKELNGLGIKLNSSQSIKESSAASKEYQKVLLQLTKLQKDYATQQNQLAKAQQALADSQKKSNDAAKTSSKLTTEEKLAKAELLKVEKERIKLKNAELGSYNALEVQLTKATRIYKNLSEAQRNSARGSSLNKFIDETNTKLKTLDYSQGKFQRNVGNYTNSLSGLFDKVAGEISRLKAKQDELTQRKAVEGFITSAQQQELDKAVTGVAELTRVMAISEQEGLGFQQAVRKIGFEFSNLNSSGNQSKEFLNEFKQDAAKAKDAAQDLKDEIKALSSDTRKLDLAVGTVSVMASAFEAGAGAAALFGANSEDVAKVTQKLVAIQSVANGIREVGEQITKRGTAANKAYNFVVAQGNTLFGKGVPLAQRFGAALKGIVVLAVIGFLIQLVQAMQDAGDGTEYAEKRLKKYNDELERNKKISQSIDDSNEADFKDNLERLKRQGIEKEKLANSEAEKAIIAAEYKKKAFDLEVKYKEEQIALLEVRQKNANEDEIDEAVRQNLYLAELAKKGVKTITKEEGEALKENRKATEAANEAAKDQLQKAYRDLKQFKNQNATSEVEDDKALYEKKRETAKEAADQERKDAYDLAIYKQELVKKLADYEADEDPRSNTNKKVEAARKAQEAEEKALEIMRKRDLDQEKLSNSKREDINLHSDEAIAESRFQLGLKITRIRVEALQKEREAASDAFDEELHIREAGLQKQLTIVDTNYSLDKAQNVKNFEDKLITLEQFNKQSEKIEADHQRVLLQLNIDGLEAQAELLEKGSQGYLDIQKAIADARAKLVEDSIAKIILTKDQEKEALAETAQNYYDTYKQIADSFVNLMGGIAEKRKRDLDDQKDKIDILKEAELDRVSKSGEAEETKAAKIKIIEVQAQARKDQLDRKQRQADRQQAIFERSFKGFQIITDTIQQAAKIRAIIAAHIAAGNPILAGVATSQLVLTIAGGAAALTSLLATPLPKYWTGTDSSKEGPAHVAEKGREIGIEPSGKMKIWERHTIANLKKGTKIFSNRVTEDIISSAKQDIVHPALGFTEEKEDVLGKAMLSELKEIKRKQGIYIYNTGAIESTAYYQQQMKN